MQTNEDSLRQLVFHLIMDFRRAIVEVRLKQIQREMRQAGNDMERIRQLMQDCISTQELRNICAKKLGIEVIA